jgi:ABC-type thiamine transport system substrate-binding protein
VYFFDDIFQEAKNVTKICDEFDLLVGINNAFFFEVEHDLFLEEKPENLRMVEEEFIFDASNHVIPFGFQYLGFLFHENKEIPLTLGHLQDKQWKNKILLPNCETTSIGRAALYWSVALFEDNGYRFFWKSLKENFYLITPNSEEALDRFLIREAPICLHVVTQSKKDLHYQIPIEGYYQFIEGMAIPKNSSQPELAKTVMNLLLSEPMQKLISSSQNLLPVHKVIFHQEIKEQYRIPNFNTTGRLHPNRIKAEKDIWLKQWKQINKI